MPQASIAVGNKAPAFSLKNQDDQTVSLAGLKGRWVVLYFYPRDDTPGCTVEACDFTAGIKAFEEIAATVLGCSADSTESHRKFIAKHKLKVTLVSDPDHQVMKSYGAWGEKNNYGKVSMGIIRSTVIIAPDSRIAHHWPKVRAEGHAQAVRDKLFELRADA